MSVLFSRSCEYAIQAVLYLATQPPDEMYLIKEIAEKLEIPIHFLAKILQNLSRDGLLESQKGPNGGFALGRPPGKITLLQIVEAVDGLSFLDRCVVGFPSCSPDDPCPLHGVWEEIRDRIKKMLADESIEQLVKDAGDKVKGAARVTS